MELSRPRGTRDFLFEEMKQRKQVEATLKKSKLLYLRIYLFLPRNLGKKLLIKFITLKIKVDGI
jgi:hypothetical protein